MEGVDVLGEFVEGVTSWRGAAHDDFQNGLMDAEERGRYLGFVVRGLGEAELITDGLLSEEGQDEQRQGEERDPGFQMSDLAKGWKYSKGAREHYALDVDVLAKGGDFADTDFRGPEVEQGTSAAPEGTAVGEDCRTVARERDERGYVLGRWQGWTITAVEAAPRRLCHRMQGASKQ